MNRKIIKIIIVSSMICIFSTSIAMAKNISNKLALSSDRTKHVENQEPLYKSNKTVDKSTLKSEREIREKVDKQQIKTKNSNVKSASMKTWTDHIKQDDPSDSTTMSKDIDPNHLVWVVVTNYPDGLDTKAGFYANAKLISVFDSVTGELIKSKVTGDGQD